MINEDVLLLARSDISYKTKRLLLNNKRMIDLELNNFYKKDDLTFHLHKVKQEITAVYNNGCEIISILDDDYPDILKEIVEAPIILTLKGNKKILKDNLFAIVGSRKVEDCDCKLIKKITDAVNSIGVKVVSGLAKGTDIVAHTQGVKFGTIAVLPCGLNYCYPKEHQNFCKKILDNDGLIISEYSFFEEVKQRNFVKRNRIITGLSKAVFIGRCDGFKTGTMSSARFAQKQRRKIYTYDFRDSIGNDFLLTQGIANKIKDLNLFKEELLQDFNILN